MGMTQRESREPGGFYEPGFMNLSSYRLAPAHLGVEWDRTVGASAQGSIFSLTPFLTALRSNAALWYCFKNDELKASIALIGSEPGSTSLHPLVVYGGIMFQPPPPRQNRSQMLSEEFRVTSFVIRELTTLYRTVQFSTHPHFGDLRPILWHNFGGKSKFEVKLKYTSMLQLPSNSRDWALDGNPLYDGAATSRRQEVRYGIRDGLQTIVDFRPELFVDLYWGKIEATASGLGLGPHFLEELKAVLENLYRGGLLTMYITNSSSGSVQSIAVLGHDDRRAYYLFGASAPGCHKSAGTIVLWHGFRDLWSRGFREVDLEGVNSPRRGYFKLSFGGSLEPYFHVLI
jgi:hypothetical protein